MTKNEAKLVLTAVENGRAYDVRSDGVTIGYAIGGFVPPVQSISDVGTDADQYDLVCALVDPRAGCEVGDLQGWIAGEIEGEDDAFAAICVWSSVSEWCAWERGQVIDDDEDPEPDGEEQSDG